MGKDKKPITIYWSPFSVVNKQYEQLLVDVPFKPVVRDIVKRKPKEPILPKSNHSPHRVPGGFYQRCTAFHVLADNMYYFEFPFDVTVTIGEDGTFIPFYRMHWFAERGQTIEGAFNADFLYELAFFADEPLEMSVTPPYLHQTPQSSYGFVTAVKWDIGQWFRPVNFLFQLWPGIREFSIKKGEVFAYVHFHTERPIVFKQVELTEKMLEIGRACFNHKEIFPNTPLSILYEKFKRKGVKSILIEEMKKNVIKN